jgi:hypothetical protein
VPGLTVISPPPGLNNVANSQREAAIALKNQGALNTQEMPVVNDFAVNSSN